MPVRFPVARHNVAAINVHRVREIAPGKGDKEPPYEG
jgi:hypothetical protein